MENILVGVIVFGAAVYAVRRLFVRRDCGCGRGRACGGTGKSGKSPGSDGEGGVSSPAGSGGSAASGSDCA